MILAAVGLALFSSCIALWRGFIARPSGCAAVTLAAGLAATAALSSTCPGVHLLHLAGSHLGAALGASVVAYVVAAALRRRVDGATQRARGRGSTNDATEP